MLTLAGVAAVATANYLAAEAARAEAGFAFGPPPAPEAAAAARRITVDWQPDY